MGNEAIDNAASAAAIDASWILVIVIVLCLIAAGRRFVLQSFQAYVFPHISLRRIAEEVHFLFAIALAFAGAAAFVAGITFAGPSMDKYSETWIKNVTMSETARSSSNYKDLAQQKAMSDLHDKYDLIFKTNIVLIPLIPIIFWLVLLFLVWIFAKLFQTPITLGHFIRTMGYNSFLFGVGSGVFVFNYIHMLAGTSAPMWVMPVGYILIIYAAVHFIISLAQGLDVSPPGIGVSLILGLAIIGGALYFVYNQYALPGWQEYWGVINAFDPSRGVR